MKTVTVELTSRDITLIRCGLLRRMDNLIGRDDVRDSYDRSKELLQILWDARKTIERE
jgi:hypothetical protein